MSISQLATYVDLQSVGTHYGIKGQRSGRINKTYNPTGDITRITIHHAAGVVTNLTTFSSILADPDREVSYNYAIDRYGNIGSYLDESNRPWTSSSPENDFKAVTIEVSNSTTSPKWKVSDDSYMALLKLCDDICRRNNIKELTYTGELAGSNLTMHKWFDSTECPGPYLEDKFSDIAATVNEWLKGPRPYTFPDGSKSNSYQVATGNSAVTSAINSMIGNACPYVALLTHKTESKILKSWKTKCSISAVVLEAGNLYDTGHNELFRFESSKLKSQVEQAKAADLPWGLYFNGKAQNVAEAKREMYFLSFVVSKYPPLAGMWIHPLIQSSKSKTNKVIDTYYKELVRLGLISNIGFKMSRKELDSFDWEKYHTDWFLWIEDPVSDFSNLKTNITPQFFTTGVE